MSTVPPSQAPLVEATPDARDHSWLRSKVIVIAKSLRTIATPSVILLGHIVGATLMFVVLFLFSVGFAKGLDWADDRFEVSNFIRFVFTWLERGSFLLDCTLYVFYLAVAARGFMRELLHLFKKEGG